MSVFIETRPSRLGEERVDGSVTRDNVMRVMHYDCIASTTHENAVNVLIIRKRIHDVEAVKYF